MCLFTVIYVMIIFTLNSVLIQVKSFVLCLPSSSLQLLITWRLCSGGSTVLLIGRFVDCMLKYPWAKYSTTR